LGIFGSSIIDYFVGSRQNIRWNCQSDLLGYLEINYQALITGGAADVFVAHLTSAVSRG
jgi:hypothetical protein